MKTGKHFYIETFGCQMNDRDSEIMRQLLEESSYSVANSIESADLIVVNTCSVREKAEQKAYSLLGTLKKLKKKNPALVVAVTGCVAQQDGKNLLKRIPHADLIVGPQKIYELPALVEAVQRKGKPQFAVDQSKAFVIPPFCPTWRPIPNSGASSPSCRAATISAHTVLCRTSEGGSGAVMPRASWRRSAKPWPRGESKT